MPQAYPPAYYPAPWQTSCPYVYVKYQPHNHPGFPLAPHVFVSSPLAPTRLPLAVTLASSSSFSSSFTSTSTSTAAAASTSAPTSAFASPSPPPPPPTPSPAYPQRSKKKVSRPKHKRGKRVASVEAQETLLEPAARPSSTESLSALPRALTSPETFASQLELPAMSSSPPSSPSPSIDDLNRSRPSERIGGDTPAGRDSPTAADELTHRQRLLNLLHAKRPRNSRGPREIRTTMTRPYYPSPLSRQLKRPIVPRELLRILSVNTRKREGGREDD